MWDALWIPFKRRDESGNAILVVLLCGEATIRESLELQSSQSKDQLENLCYH